MKALESRHVSHVISGSARSDPEALFRNHILYPVLAHRQSDGLRDVHQRPHYSLQVITGPSRFAPVVRPQATIQYLQTLHRTSLRYSTPSKGNLPQKPAICANLMQPLPPRLRHSDICRDSLYRDQSHTVRLGPSRLTYFSRTRQSAVGKGSRLRDYKEDNPAPIIIDGR